MFDDLLSYRTFKDKCWVLICAVYAFLCWWREISIVMTLSTTFWTVGILFTFVCVVTVLAATPTGYEVTKSFVVCMYLGCRYWLSNRIPSFAQVSVIRAFSYLACITWYVDHLVYFKWWIWLFYFYLQFFMV